PRAHRDRQADGQGAGDPRPRGPRGRARRARRRRRPRCGDIPQLLRGRRAGEAVRGRRVLHVVLRPGHLQERGLPPRGGPGGPQGAAAGGDRRPLPPARAAPGEAQRAVPDPAHPAVPRRGEGDGRRRPRHGDHGERRAGLRGLVTVAGRAAGADSPMPETGGVKLLGPADVRALAELLNLRPTKRLGQNFVIDGGTLRRIVRLAQVTPEDVVLEVGPGLGSLTLALLPEAAQVVAVEVDPVLAERLPVTVAEYAPEVAGRLRVVRADALRIGPEDLGVAPDALVANLPYNVAVPILLHLFAVLPSLRRGLVMVQAEVADRLTAQPGSKLYGVPSVKIAWFAEVRRAGSVGRSVFWPVPNVDSGLVALVRRDPPKTTASREEVFAVVDAAFAQRRKTL